MGLCETKERKYNSILIPTFIKSIHSKDNLNNKIKKNDFFYFTELIIKYKFYNKLDKNNENSTRLITNENNIFKVIKAIDKIQRTKFNNNTLKHPSLKSQSTIFKSQIDTKRSNSDVNFYDFKLNINGLFGQNGTINYLNTKIIPSEENEESILYDYDNLPQIFITIKFL